MRKRLAEIAVAVVLLALVAACGGGGGGASNPPAAIPRTPTSAPGPTTTTAPGSQTASATIRITIPAGVASKANGRATKLVTANTKGITFTLLKSNGISVNGVTSAPFGLTASSPGCTADASGNVACVLQLDAPLGDDLYVAQTYSTVNAAPGTQNGSGTLALTIARNAANNANLVLNGPIASVVLALGSIPQPGGSTRVFAVALDSSGSVIINPATYDQPIYLKIALNNVPASIGLAVTYAIPGSNSAAAPTPAPGASTSVSPGPVPSSGGSASTNQDGGSIPILSPQDVITLSYASAAQYAPPGQQIPTITAYVGSLAAPAQVPALQLPWLIFGAVPTPTPPPATAPPGTPPPALSVLPANLNFQCTDYYVCGGSQNATATSAGAGTITADASACSSLGYLVGQEGYAQSGPSPLTFGFSANGYSGGTCNITVTSGGQTQTVAVTVRGPLTINGTAGTTSVNCTLVPAVCSPSNTVSLGESGFAGAFMVGQAPCAGIATLGGPFTNPASATLMPLGEGLPCAMTISDGLGLSATLSVSVSGIVIDHPNLLCYSGSTICRDAGTSVVVPGSVVHATEAGMTFTVTAPSCASVATVSPVGTMTPSPANITVTPIAPGTCTATVSDGTAAAQISVNVIQPVISVRTFGSPNFVIVNGSAPTYTIEHANRATTMQLQLYSNFTTGALSLSSNSCSGFGAGPGLAGTFPFGAGITNGGFLNINSFTMTPLGPGTNYCSFTVQDALTGAATTVNFTADDVNVFVQKKGRQRK